VSVQHSNVSTVLQHFEQLTTKGSNITLEDGILTIKPQEDYCQ
jgi:hypothetical protein